MGTYIALLGDNKVVDNKLGYHVKVTAILKDWDKALNGFCRHLINNKFPIGYTLFVPDFFAINFGILQVLQSFEIDLFMRSIAEVNKVLKLQQQQNQVIAVQIYKPYLGTQFIW